MTPRQAVDYLLVRDFVEDGEPTRASLIAVDGPHVVQRARKSPGGDVPPEIVDLFRLGAGVRIGSQELRWDGTLSGQHLDDVVPAGWPVMVDGFGNSWNVEIDPERGTWGSVYFFCHDPPVILYQAPDLGAFLEQFAAENAPESSPGQRLLTFVHDAAAMTAWRTGGTLVRAEALRDTTDPVLRRIVALCAAGESICDLRSAKPGDGFRWGGSGSGILARRPLPEPVFIISARGPAATTSGGILSRLTRAVQRWRGRD